MFIFDESKGPFQSNVVSDWVQMFLGPTAVQEPYNKPLPLTELRSPRQHCLRCLFFAAVSCTVVISVHRAVYREKKCLWPKLYRKISDFLQFTL